MEQGLVHLYWGEGKGKTTAAMGLALRALGRGLCVQVVQFLKSGESGELEPLRRLGAEVHSGACEKFVFQMSRQERQAVREAHNAALMAALKSPCDLLVLDEACAASQLELVDDVLLKRAVLERPQGCEVVLTGRDPAQWMQNAADYSIEMRCHKHPFERGIPAREGIEF